MPQSTVPAALTALTGLFSTAAGPTVTTVLGALSGGDIPPDYLIVGGGIEDQPGVVGAVQIPDMGNYGKQAADAYVIWCTLSVSSGEESPVARMARADVIFQALCATVRANRNLSGIIAPPGLIEVGSYQWTFDEGGAIVSVFFQVAVNAPWIQVTP